MTPLQMILEFTKTLIKEKNGNGMGKTDEKSSEYTWGATKIGEKSKNNKKM